MSVTRPRVLLADDHPGMLAAIRLLLEPSCEIVGQVRDGASLLDAAASTKPDVVVVDLSMPDMNGFEACRRLRQAAPHTRVVLLTAYTDVQIGREALASGASAYVPKQRAAQDLVDAVRAAATSAPPSH